MTKQLISFDELRTKQSAVAVVGLGYVGLPLTVALGEHFKVIGFDISERRVDELRRGIERTGEVAPSRLGKGDVEYTADPSRLAEARFIIVAVPTPIDGHRRPDLRPVCGASRTVGEQLTPGSVVVYESTVYPGLTEDVCVPILEEHSGLRCGDDFQVGYSPERINPGDKRHTLRSIVKVVAGQTPESADLLERVYGAVVDAGTHRASSIKVAEAAKVIENTQRDLNISLMNELAMIFDRMGIDTLDVLEAAGTKWNFLPFRPGLVGGHCIGVDPYYLTFKAESLGLYPQVILAGRKINDGMGKFVAEAAVKRLIKSGTLIRGARVGVLGLTFKENVPDLRNTRVVDVIAELEDYGCEVLVTDAMADPEEAHEEYGIDLLPLEDLTGLDAVILCVAHDAYRSISVENLKGMFRDPEQTLVVDIKGFFDRDELDGADIALWRL